MKQLVIQIEIEESKIDEFVNELIIDLVKKTMEHDYHISLSKRSVPCLISIDNDEGGYHESKTV